MGTNPWTEACKAKKFCGLSAVTGLAPMLCREERCALWVSTSRMCTFKDMAHSIKQIAGEWGKF